MKHLVCPVILLLLVGCTSSQIAVRKGEFKSVQLDQALNFYVATHPSPGTNHFYVGATCTEAGNLLDALVYWKEQRTILSYAELQPTSTRVEQAWKDHELKLDRDTVDTQEEIGGSNYLITHRQWADWAHQCISKGQLHVVRRADAMRAFPEK